MSNASLIELAIRYCENHDENQSSVMSENFIPNFNLARATVIRLA